MRKSLIDCEKNQNVVVTDTSSLSSKIQRRLGSFGIFVSSSILVQNKSILKKTILVKVNKNIFAIGESVAKQIFVEVRA